MKKGLIIASVIVATMLAGVVTISMHHAAKCPEHHALLADIIITRTCPTCKGERGTYVNGEWKVCPTCNGTGKITTRSSHN